MSQNNKKQSKRQGINISENDIFVVPQLISPSADSEKKQAPLFIYSP